MDDDGTASWDRIITLIFVIGSIIVLMLLLFMVFIMPSLQQ
jgi:hypothetical protein